MVNAGSLPLVCADLTNQEIDRLKFTVQIGTLHYHASSFLPRVVRSCNVLTDSTGELSRHRGSAG